MNIPSSLHKVGCHKHTHSTLRRGLEYILFHNFSSAVLDPVEARILGHIEGWDNL